MTAIATPYSQKTSHKTRSFLASPSSAKMHKTASTPSASSSETPTTDSPSKIISSAPASVDKAFRAMQAVMEPTVQQASQASQAPKSTSAHAREAIHRSEERRVGEEWMAP